MITITLNKIKAHNIRWDVRKKLITHLGKTKADDQEFPLAEVLKSNGLSDALWCLRCLPEHDRKWKLLAVNFAQEVQHLMKDERSINALAVAERHLRGDANDSELESAIDAARDAANDAYAWAEQLDSVVDGDVAIDAADLAAEAAYIARVACWSLKSVVHASHAAWAAINVAVADPAVREKQLQLFKRAIQ